MIIAAQNHPNPRWHTVIGLPMGRRGAWIHEYHTTRCEQGRTGERRTYEAREEGGLQKYTLGKYFTQRMLVVHIAPQ